MITVETDSLFNYDVLAGFLKYLSPAVVFSRKTNYEMKLDECF